MAQINRSQIQIVPVLLILIGLQLLFTLQLRMHSPPVTEPKAEKVESFNPKLFEVMSFGQLPAVIDWMWIKSLQDPLTSHVAKGTHPAVFYTVDLITELDPAFMEAYIGGATLVSVIRDDGPGALHILLKGEAFLQNELAQYSKEFKNLYWTPDWQIPMLLAYVYLFDMDDLPHATMAFREASHIEGSPAYVKELVQHLEKQGGQYEVGMKLIDFMISGAHDPDVKDRLETRREALKVSFFIFEMNERFQKYLDLHRVSKETLHSVDKSQALWEEFVTAKNISLQDPWGGTLALGDLASGQVKVTTTTPHRKVFGLE